MGLEACLKEGSLQKIPRNKEWEDKEWKESEYDLSEAQALFQEKRFKRATITSYYAMFHAAKAVLFSKGYREKTHYAIIVVLEHLANKGEIETRLVHDFRAALHARHQADYNYTYSKETAERLLAIAKEFVEKMKKTYC